MIVLTLLVFYTLLRCILAVRYMDKYQDKIIMTDDCSYRRIRLFYDRLSPFNLCHWKPWTLWTGFFSEGELRFLFNEVNKNE